MFGMGTGVSPPPYATWNLKDQLKLQASEQSVCHIRLRPISTARLNALLRLHLRPINLLVSKGSDMETSS